jgi:hypothetical protein
MLQLAASAEFRMGTTGLTAILRRLHYSQKISIGQTFFNMYKAKQHLIAGDGLGYKHYPIVHPPHSKSFMGEAGYLH